MKLHKISKLNSSEILFQGQYECFKSCLEDAVRKKINLSAADLRNQNLNNANLDDAILPFADFTNANLSGANLSESTLTNAIFKNTTLYNCCLCYSNLKNCNFTHAQFGATDINGAIICASTFSGLSCFSLNFMSAQLMHGCYYIDADTNKLEMSSPPIVINGIHKHPIVILDKVTIKGPNIMRNSLHDKIDTLPDLKQNAIKERFLSRYLNKQ